MNATELAGKEWRVSECGGVWRVIETLNDGGEWFIARCYDRMTAEAIASLPKLAKALQFVLDNGENEYVESEIRVTLAALDHE